MGEVGRTMIKREKAIIDMENQAASFNRGIPIRFLNLEQIVVSFLGFILYIYVYRGDKREVRLGTFIQG